MNIINSFNTILDENVSGYDEIKDIIYVYDVSGDNIRLFHDMKNERTLCVRL